MQCPPERLDAAGWRRRDKDGVRLRFAQRRDQRAARGAPGAVEATRAGERETAYASGADDHRADRRVVGSARRRAVAQHIEPPDALVAHEPHARSRLGEVRRDESREGVVPGQEEALRLARSIEATRVGEADVGAPGADLENVVGVDDRQRDRRRGRVVIADVGDRVEVLARGARLLAVPRPARLRCVVERGEADRTPVRPAACLLEREDLAVDDALHERRLRSLERQRRIDGQRVLVGEAAGLRAGGAAAGESGGEAEGRNQLSRPAHAPPPRYLRFSTSANELPSGLTM